MELVIRQKAYVYCVDAGRLLVLRHPDEPWTSVGLQVPGGSVRDGESPAAAALRELVEETGLDSFVLQGFLGTSRYNLSPYRGELQERFFYQARLTARTPDRWRSAELHDGRGAPTPYEFLWIPLIAGHVLQAGHGELLWRVSA